MVSDVAEGIGRGQAVQASQLLGLFQEQWEANGGCQAGRYWVWFMFYDLKGAGVGAREPVRSRSSR